MAQRLRKTINDRLSTGPQRRTFWERFVDRAFQSPADAKSEAVTLKKPRTLRHPRRTAALGDAALLTLKAVRVFQAADVILFDDLVSDEILELARREAKREMTKGDGPAA